MKKLSPDEKNEIEQSLWVVNAVLKKQGQSGDEDLRQEACLYLMECYRRYDKRFGVKWTTYAYKSIYLFVKRSIASKKKEENTVVGGETYETAKAANGKEEEYNIGYKELYEICNEQERKVLELRYIGYTRPEICEEIQTSEYYVNGIIKTLKEKAKNLFKEEK